MESVNRVWLSMWLLFFSVTNFATSRSFVAQEPASAVGPLMKLFQSGRLPPERQGTVVEMICARGNDRDLKVVFDRAVQPVGFAKDLRLKSLGWLTDAASTRKVIPAGDLTAIETLVKDPDRNLQLAAIRLATFWKVPSIGKALQQIASDQTSAPELQRAAVEGLVTIGGQESRSTLATLATNAESTKLRMLAVGGLTGLDLAGASELAADILANAQPDVDTNEMVVAFLDRKDGSDALAAAIKRRSLQVDVAKKALRHMYSIGRSDAALSAVLSDAAGVAADPPPPTQEQVAMLGQEVLANGDAARGEIVFRRADLSCFRCHSINRAGGQVGPDLSAIGRDSPIDYVVNSILNPNLAVKELYVTKVFFLVSGKVLTGVVVDRDDNRILIRDSQGKTVTISAADVEEEAEGKSLMPQGLTKFLTHDEVLDLARFIFELGKPGPYEARSVPTINLWKVLTSPAKELTDEIPHMEHVRQLILGAKAEEWTSAYAKFSGSLPLDELRSGNKPIIKILQGEIQVDEAGKLRLNIVSTEPYQAWLNDQPLEARPNLEMDVPQGRHKLTIRVEISPRALPEFRVDVIRPEDSNIQFQVVSGS